MKQKLLNMLEKDFGYNPKDIQPNQEDYRLYWTNLLSLVEEISYEDLQDIISKLKKEATSLENKKGIKYYKSKYNSQRIDINEKACKLAIAIATLSNSKRILTNKKNLIKELESILLIPKIAYRGRCEGYNRETYLFNLRYSRYLEFMIGTGAISSKMIDRVLESINNVFRIVNTSTQLCYRPIDVKRDGISYCLEILKKVKNIPIEQRKKIIDTIISNDKRFETFYYLVSNWEHKREEIIDKMLELYSSPVLHNDSDFYFTTRISEEDKKFIGEEYIDKIEEYCLLFLKNFGSRLSEEMRKKLFHTIINSKNVDIIFKLNEFIEENKEKIKEEIKEKTNVIIIDRIVNFGTWQQIITFAQESDPISLRILAFKMVDNKTLSDITEFRTWCIKELSNLESMQNKENLYELWELMSWYGDIKYKEEKCKSFQDPAWNLIQNYTKNYNAEMRKVLKPLAPKTKEQNPQ